MSDKPRKSISTAVIVAAGKGNRLQDAGIPKPLVSLVGLPLIVRVMAAAAGADHRQVGVVGGHRAGFIRGMPPRILP